MSKFKTSLKEPDIDNRLIDERGPTHEWVEKFRKSPIEYAADRGQISRLQSVAAERFRYHWEGAGMRGRIGAINFDRVSGVGNEEPTDSYLRHISAFNSAVTVLGNRATHFMKIVCDEHPIIEWGYEMGYRKRQTQLWKGLEALRESLDILCREWGLST